MAVDAAKNFGKVTVSTGYDASAVSVVLSTGDGAKLPTVPFNATWWNATDYPDPSDDPNVEIVRVTGIATDTLTVTRAQESTSASTKNTAGKTYKMLAGLTAKAINTDLPATYAGLGANTFTGIQDVQASARFKGPGPWVDVMSGGFTHKCSASRTTTTLSSGASSSATTLALTSAIDFATGHGIFLVLDNGTVHRSYITAGGGTASITINDALPSAAASGKTIGHDDTLAFQDALDFANTNALNVGVVYVAPGQYNIWQIKLYANQTLFLSGRTGLFSVPGNTSTAMIVLNAATVGGVRITGGVINGFKSGSPAPTAGGILLDNTGQTNIIDHWIVDVIVKNTVGDGVSLKSVVQSKVNNMTISGCNGHGFRTDSLCFDNTFNAVRVSLCGLHNVYHQGSGDVYIGLHSGSAGQVDATSYGDNVNVTGRANKIVGWVGHALRDGIRFDGASNNDAEVMIHSNTNYHVSVVNSASNNRVRAQMGYNNTEQAVAVLNMASGTQNDIEIAYYTGSLAANNPPAIGAALSGSDNYISMRNGTKNGTGDINTFEGEPLYVTQDWTRTSPTTLWRYPNSVVYRQPG